MINIDVLPGTVALPRRYAFRYLKVQIVDSSPSFRVKFEDILCRTVSSADPRQVQPRSSQLPPEWQAIDRVSLRTLANRMQTVFEDGPKRDRRLWRGDMCVQALANYATFRNYALTKRCLYLFAGVADREGKLPAELYERPVARAGSCFLMDGVGLFPGVLHEYCRASGDRLTAVELWAVARRQIDVAIRHLDASGLFVDPGNVLTGASRCTGMRPCKPRSSVASVPPSTCRGRSARSGWFGDIDCSLVPCGLYLMSTTGSVTPERKSVLCITF